MDKLKEYEFNILKYNAKAEIKVKKSRFIAAVRLCKSEDEAKPFIDEIRKYIKTNELYDVCAAATRYFRGTFLGRDGCVCAYFDVLKKVLSVRLIFV